MSQNACIQSNCVALVCQPIRVLRTYMDHRKFARERPLISLHGSPAIARCSLFANSAIHASVYTRHVDLPGTHISIRVVFIGVGGPRFICLGEKFRAVDPYDRSSTLIVSCRATVGPYWYTVFCTDHIRFELRTPLCENLKNKTAFATSSLYALSVDDCKTR